MPLSHWLLVVAHFGLLFAWSSAALRAAPGHEAFGVALGLGVTVVLSVVSGARRRILQAIAVADAMAATTAVLYLLMRSETWLQRLGYGAGYLVTFSLFVASWLTSRAEARRQLRTQKDREVERPSDPRSAPGNSEGGFED